MQCKYRQVGQRKTLFLVATSLLAASTGLCKRCRAPRAWLCAADKCPHRILLSPGVFLSRICARNCSQKQLGCHCSGVCTFQHFCSLSPCTPGSRAPLWWVLQQPPCYLGCSELESTPQGHHAGPGGDLGPVVPGGVVGEVVQTR